MEAKMLETIDTSLRVASRALERRSYAFAAKTFRASLSKLVRQLPTGSEATMSAAVKMRLEAASAYGVLCQILQECEELHSAAMQGNPTNEMASRLCFKWACVLRIAKAPYDTVQFAVQAMATFYSFGRMVGGWAAAEEVATMLLVKCNPMLSNEELEQAEYVKQSSQHGRVARGASSKDGTAVCGACPRCRGPLEALAQHCLTCGTEIAVCFEDGALCDAHLAGFCTLCGAVAKEAGREAVLCRARNDALGGGKIMRSVRSRTCFMCGLGEMLPRRHKQQLHLTH